MSTNLTLSLYRFSGYESITAGEHTLQLVAKGEGKSDSSKSSAITFNKTDMPAKGQLISLNLTGTTAQYRVLKVSGNNAEIVAMTNSSSSSDFGSSRVYANSTLDKYLNETWYNSLTDTAKAAIVDKTFTQDSWYLDSTGSPVYNGYYGASKPGTTAYSVSLGNSAFGNSITRHVYALSVQDVIDYVKDTSFGRDGELQNYNTWKMFWNDEVAHSETSNYIWLRSARASSSSSAFYVDGRDGSVYSRDVGSTLAVRPALTIDLSKISWS